MVLRSLIQRLGFSAVINQQGPLPKAERILDLYVDVMIRSLTNSLYQDPSMIGRGEAFDLENRVNGRDWPKQGFSMAGHKRLRSLADQVIETVQNGVPGDFIETGVWRGGACALVRGLYKALDVSDRRVFVADSFQGLPPPDPDSFPQDKNLDLSIYPELAIPLKEVKKTFEAYGLLDDQVQFVEGWFKDTLHKVDSQCFSIIRLDGDLYESTIQALDALYPKLSAGGYLIVDDYGAIPACRKAVKDYRTTHGITSDIHEIDWTGVYWQRVGDSISNERTRNENVL
ncbi:MAG: TylF/MycF/NovP-related O-methyltransferase [Pseudomonadota bacterium]